MTVQIPLRAKYLTGRKSTYKGGERPAPKKSRKKVGYEKHVARFGVPPKKVMMVNGKTGHRVMKVVKSS